MSQETNLTPRLVRWLRKGVEEGEISVNDLRAALPDIAFEQPTYEIGLLPLMARHIDMVLIDCARDMVVGEIFTLSPFPNLAKQISEGEMDAQIKAAARGYLMKLPVVHTATPASQFEIQRRIKL